MPQMNKNHFPIFVQEDSDHGEIFSLYNGITIIKATNIKLEWNTMHFHDVIRTYIMSKQSCEQHESTMIIRIKCICSAQIVPGDISSFIYF